MAKKQGTIELSGADTGLKSGAPSSPQTNVSLYGRGLDEAAREGLSTARRVANMTLANNDKIARQIEKTQAIIKSGMEEQSRALDAQAKAETMAFQEKLETQIAERETGLFGANSVGAKDRIAKDYAALLSAFEGDNLVVSLEGMEKPIQFGSAEQKALTLQAVLSNLARQTGMYETRANGQVHTAVVDNLKQLQYTYEDKAAKFPSNVDALFSEFKNEFLQFAEGHISPEKVEANLADAWQSMNSSALAAHVNDALADAYEGPESSGVARINSALNGLDRFEHNVDEKTFQQQRLALVRAKNSFKKDLEADAKDYAQRQAYESETAFTDSVGTLNGMLDIAENSIIPGGSVSEAIKMARDAAESARKCADHVFDSQMVLGRRTEKDLSLRKKAMYQEVDMVYQVLEKTIKGLNAFKTNPDILVRAIRNR